MKKNLTTDEMKARANRLHLAHQDMVEVKYYLDALEELTCTISRDNRSFCILDAIPAIYIAIIIVYTRPFVNSYSKGKADPRLIPEDIQLFDNDCELEILHNRLIELRSTAVAHADWTQHNTNLVTDDKQVGLKREHSRPDYMRGIDIALLRRLAKHVEVATKGLTYDIDIYYQTEIERSEATMPTDK